MENEGAQPFDTVIASIKGVERCDIYIGIFGSIYSPTTVKEYKKARSLGITILVYLRDNVTREFELDKFIQKYVRNNHKYKRFKTNSDLYEKVVDDLEDHMLFLLKEGIKSSKEVKVEVKKQTHKRIE